MNQAEKMAEEIHIDCSFNNPEQQDRILKETAKLIQQVAERTLEEAAKEFEKWLDIKLYKTESNKIAAAIRSCRWWEEEV